MNTIFTLQEIAEITNGTILNCQRPDECCISSISTDSRNCPESAFFLALKGERFDAHNFLDSAVDSGAKGVIINTDQASCLNCNVPACLVADTLTAYQQIASWHRNRLNTTVIGVTGSSGKTSCKEILRSIFAEAYGVEAVYATKANTNNHIGVPQNLLNLTECHKIAIIEMGTNHPGEIEVLTNIAQPDVAMISSIGSSHLEFFGNTAGVAVEKSTIFKGVRNGGTAIIPTDTEHFDILSDGSEHLKQITFGQRKADLTYHYYGSDLKGSKFSLSASGRFDESEVQWLLTGQHQVSNAAACAAVALALSIPSETIIKGLQKCHLPGMRMKIQSVNGVNWINDAYNANPDSMNAGLDWLSELTLPADLILILGDMLELGDAGPAAHRQVIEHVMKAFPEAMTVFVGPVFSRECQTSSLSGKCFSVLDAEAAIPVLKDKLKQNDTVFLKGSRGMHLETILASYDT